MSTSEVDYGLDRSFSNSDNGFTESSGTGVFGSSIADYDISDNEAQAAADAQPGYDDQTASAYVYEVIYPWGSYDLVESYGDLTARFDVSGQYKGLIDAAGGGSSIEFSAFLLDASNGVYLDRDTFKEMNAGPIDYKDRSGHFDVSVYGEVNTYTYYCIGVTVEVTASSLLTSIAHADAHRSGTYNGYVNWDSIDLTWLGK